VKAKDHLEDQGIGGTVLKSIFEELGVKKGGLD
jgi:hypothetical protein